MTPPGDSLRENEDEAAHDQRDREQQSLSDAVGNILEEARMVLPGTQTLFGFQLIVVFNSRFQDRLSLEEQYLHLGATMLVATAAAMLMAPAAYRRRVEPQSASRRFVLLGSRLLRWSLVPLMLAICADFYLVASLVTGRTQPSILLALVLFAVFVGLWFVLPALIRRMDGDDAP